MQLRERLSIGDTMDRQELLSTLRPNIIRPQRRKALQHQHQQQFSSILLFVGVIVLVNLCPFQQDSEHSENLFDINNNNKQAAMESQFSQRMLLEDKSFLANNLDRNNYLTSDHLMEMINFVKLMFSNPMRLSKRTMRYTQAEARMLGKMAKVWYIKKKIKKLSKKLKKHTIAVPVFTAIPIYEHSYYPQPHVTHVSHGAMHHHAAAASSYMPAVTQLATAASSPIITGSSATGQQNQQQQQLATSASNNHQVATYRMAPSNGHQHNYFAHHQQAHQHPNAAASHQIINAYAPSPPLYVDEAGGLYGHYGNAYGRYDGGYQYW